MTNYTQEELKEVLEYQKTSTIMANSEDTINTINRHTEIIISALEKLIEKTPIKGNGFYMCPSCKAMISQKNSENGCWHCLQRLKWGKQDKLNNAKQ